MLDDSAKALEAKDQFRQGKTSRTEFEKTMSELRRIGKDRIEPRKPTPAAGSRKVIAAAGLTVTTASSTADPWIGRDNAAGARGSDSSRDDEVGAAPGMKRPVSSSRVLSKLGGRLVAGFAAASLRTDQASSSGHGSSPAPEGARSDGGGRRRSPRRGLGSPRHHHDASNESGGGFSSWRPWSAPTIAGRNGRKIASTSSSPERSAPSPGDTPVRGGGSGVEGRQSPVESQRRAEHGGAGDAGRAASTGAPLPLTASEIDNMSSVSNTSTVLTDLSLRLEKIEDMLSRLLEAHNPTRLLPGSGGGGGNDASGTVLGSRGRFSNADEEAADDFTGVVTDTAEELREVRWRLRQLEVEETARAAATATAAAAASRATTAPDLATLPARSVAALAFSQSTTVIVDEKAVQSTSGVAAATSTGGGGGNRVRSGGAPASELPACEDYDDDELSSSGDKKSAARPTPVLTPALSWDEDGKEEEMVPSSRTAAPAVTRGIELEGDAGRKQYRGEGEKGGESKDEEDAKVDEPDGAPADRGSGGVLRRGRSFRLSTITEAPV